MKSDDEAENWFDGKCTIQFLMNKRARINEQ